MSAATHIRLDGSSVRFGTCEAQPEDLVIALQRYLASGKTAKTPEIEKQARSLIAQGYTKEDDINDFILAVCVWGGYAGISGRVRKHNKPKDIRARLMAAMAAIERGEPDLRTAIREVRALNGLGLSFASKHLRMLWPQHCPVLDSQLHKHLGYPLNSTGYTSLARDCRVVATFLEAQGMPNRARDDRAEWYVADVEAAVFKLVHP